MKRVWAGEGGVGHVQYDSLEFVYVLGCILVRKMLIWQVIGFAVELRAMGGNSVSGVTQIILLT